MSSGMVSFHGYGCGSASPRSGSAAAGTMAHGSTDFCNSGFPDNSITRIQNAALQRMKSVVARQEFKRAQLAEDMPDRDFSPVVDDAQRSLDFQAPRTCNTGALISSAYKIDWLEFTVKGVPPSVAVSSLLGLEWDVFTVLDFGMQGYPDQAQYGAVRVLWSEDKPERGTKIILSSLALDQVAHDAIDVLHLSFAEDATYARIDLALDDRSGVTSIDQFVDAVREGKDVNRFSQVETREPIDRRTREYAGRSVYWGKASSSRQVVAYDKRIEQARKTGVDTGPWVRIEARWKKRAANILAKALLENGMESIPSLIRGVVDFRELDNEQTDRRTVCEWWSAFTGAAEPIKTGIRKVVKTIEEKAAWLGRQMSKTLGQVGALLGGETILEMIRAGIHKTNSAEWRLLDPEGKRTVFTGAGKFEYVIPF